MLLLGRVMPQDEPRFFSGSFSFSWSADVIGPRQTVEQKKTFVFYHLKEGAELKKIVLSLVSASDSQIMKRRRQPLNCVLNIFVFNFTASVSALHCPPFTVFDSRFFCLHRTVEVQ